MRIEQQEFEIKVNTFFENVGDGGRYMSWEHCKNFFDENKFFIDNIEKAKENLNEENLKKLDLMCLQLAFYLASWGMYRGSAFLLQYDYKKHEKTVLTLMQEKYKSLWDCEDFDENKINLLFDLIEKLKGCYAGYEAGDDNEPTHTLVSKIIMGTMGCLPAYDRYLERGLAIHGITKSFGKKSFAELVKLAQNNQLFKNLKLSYYGKSYPRMKILDMYFWEAGYEEDVLNWLKGKNLQKDAKSAREMLKGRREKSVKKKINRMYDYFENYNDEIINEIEEIKKEHDF